MLITDLRLKCPTGIITAVLFRRRVIRPLPVLSPVPVSVLPVLVSSPLLPLSASVHVEVAVVFAPDAVRVRVQEDNASVFPMLSEI